MRRIILPGLVCAGIAVAATLWPAEAHAQRRGARIRHSPRHAVVVRASYYRPFYRPFFSPFYGGLYWQRYPYPYPYYGYRYDDRAEVRIQASPRDAEVYVDGYFAGTVDDFDGFAQRLRIEPGDHEITLYHPAFRTWREQVRLRPRQSLTIPASVLEPLPAGAQPDARPEPAQGTRPPARGRAEERPAGPPDQAPIGTVSIRVQPADADVWIDGEPWDWPAGDSRLVVDLPEGSHRVEVRREGHRSYSTTIEIRGGEVTTLNVSLLKGNSGDQWNW